MRRCSVPEEAARGVDHFVITISARITPNPVRGLAFVGIVGDAANDPGMSIRGLTGRSIDVVERRETLDQRVLVRRVRREYRERRIAVAGRDIAEQLIVGAVFFNNRSEEHTSELQSRQYL